MRDSSHSVVPWRKLGKAGDREEGYQPVDHRVLACLTKGFGFGEMSWTFLFLQRYFICVFLVLYKKLKKDNARDLLLEFNPHPRALGHQSSEQ